MGRVAGGFAARRAMGRAVVMAATIVATLPAANAVAQAAGRHEKWKAVENLAPGKAIKVELEQRAPPEECRVVTVDDATLTCEREPELDASWGPGDNARVVVPRDAVRAVWVWDDVSDRRILVRLGVGFAVGALICAEAGPGPAFVCAGIGALIGLVAPAMAQAGPPYPWPGMPPPSHPTPQPEWRLKLVYHAPRQAAASSATP